MCYPTCVIVSFYLTPGSGKLYFGFNNRNMLSTVTASFLPPGTGGGFRTWRSASWTHMVPTHKTTVVLSNVLHLVSFQRATETTAACVQHISSIPRTAFFFSSLLPLRDAADLETSCARERTELNQLSLRWAGGSPPPPDSKQRSYT